jgi:hypothetical protein
MDEKQRLEVRAERDGNMETLRGKETPEGQLEYELFGDRMATMEWEAEEKNSKNGRKGNKK